MAVEADDQFLVNRGGTTYTQEQETLMANLETDDLLLINRGGTSYTITGQEFVESVIDPLDITVVLNNVDPAPGDTITATAVVTGGKTPYGPVSYQWKKQASTRAFANIPGETNPTIVVTDDLLGYDLICECSVTDALGTSVTVESEPTEEVAPDGEITEPVVIISPVDGAGMSPENVTPAAEGITNVVEGIYVAPIEGVNNSEMWSDLLSGTGLRDATLGFDGDETTEAFGGDSPLTLNYTFENVTRLQIRVRAKGYGSGDVTVVVSGNGITDTSFAQGLAGELQDITLSSTTISAIKITTSSNQVATGISQIYVNDELLLDSNLTSYPGGGADPVPMATLTYTTGTSLDLMEDGQPMTMKPDYIPRSSRIVGVVDGANPVLTFEDDTDLRNFRQGDIVQGLDIPVGVAFRAVRNPNEADRFVNGDESSFATGTPITDNGTVYTGSFGTRPVITPTQQQGINLIYDFGYPVTDAVFCRYEGVDGSTRFSLWGSNDDRTYIKLADQQGINDGDGNGNYGDLNSGSTGYRYIALQTSGAGIWFENYGPTAQSENVPVKIVSIDVANKQIVTDGGDWTTEEDAFVYSNGLEGFTAGSCGAAVFGSCAFNGTTTDGAYARDALLSWDSSKIAGLQPFTGNLVTYHLYNSTADVTIYQADGSTRTESSPGDGKITWGQVTNFVKLEINQGSGSNGYLNAIEYDGEILVDAIGGENQVVGKTKRATGHYYGHDDSTIELRETTGIWCVDEQGVGLKAESDNEFTNDAPGGDINEWQAGNGIIPDIDAGELIKFQGTNVKLLGITWKIASSDDGGETYGDESSYTQQFPDNPFGLEVNEVIPAWTGPDEGLLPDTYYRATATFIGDGSSASVKSDPVYFKTSPKEKPQGVKMSGLRFDSKRQTLLSTAFGGKGNRKINTFSCWLKRTQYAAAQNLFAAEAGSANSNDEFTQIYIVGDKVVLYGSTKYYTSSIEVPANSQWVHIVASIDTTTGTDGFKLYINGVLDNGAFNATIAKDLEFALSNDITHTVGGRHGDREIIDGYLSEVYFVDGQALEPTAFGREYEGLWGPLPSETILNNITRSEDPYSQRPNMDKKWSDLVTASPSTDGSSIEDVFNDDDEEYYDGSVNPSIFTFQDASFANQVVEVMSSNGNDKGRYINVNGQGKVDVPLPKEYKAYGTATADGTISLELGADRADADNESSTLR